jgi:hypothetical protein
MLSAHGRWHLPRFRICRAGQRLVGSRFEHGQGRNRGSQAAGRGEMRMRKRAQGERLLVVSEMIRLPGIKFEKVVKRSPRLGDSQYFQSEDSHNMIESCVRVLREQNA